MMSLGDDREGSDLAGAERRRHVIAQGAEAGGHRGMFLTDITEQPGTLRWCRRWWMR